MRFTSGGCFHFYTYDLTFTRTNVSVATVNLEWIGPGENYRDGERRALGQLELSDADIVGLDTLLAFYRTNTAGGCTTKVEIKISQIRDGKVMATEKFVDSSCRAAAVKDVLTIQSLTRRLPNKKETK